MNDPADDPTTADLIGARARAFDSAAAVPVLIKQTHNDDVYRTGLERGGVVHVLLGLWTSMPPDVLHAVRIRRAATMTGRCPNCDAVASLATFQMTHEADCSVVDDLLGPLLMDWARQVGRYARGRRITEDPTAGTRNTDGRS